MSIFKQQRFIRKTRPNVARDRLDLFVIELFAILDAVIYIFSLSILKGEFRTWWLWRDEE